MPTLPVSEPTKTVSSKDTDSASIADSGHGTTVSEEPQLVSRHIDSASVGDSASVADSGHGTLSSIFSDPKEDSLSSEKTSMKEKQKGKFNVRESVMYTYMLCTNPQTVTRIYYDGHLLVF